MLINIDGSILCVDTNKKQPCVHSYTQSDILNTHILALGHTLALALTHEHAHTACL